MNIRRVARNLIANALVQITQLFINFIIPPLIVSNYGSVINGLVATARQLMSYANLVGAGIAAAGLQSLYKPLANNDSQGISIIFNSMRRMYNKAGGYFTIAIIALSLLYPITINNELNYWLIVEVILVTSLAGLSEFFIVGKYRVLLQASQKEYVVSYVQTFGLLAGFALAYTCIHFRLSIVLVQLSNSALYLSRIIILAWYSHKEFPNLVKTSEDSIYLKTQRNNAMIHQLTGLCTLGSQTIILGSLVSLEAASVFAVYNVVLSGLHSIYAHAINTFTPFVGKTIAEGDKNSLRKEYSMIEWGYSSLVAFTISICLAVLNLFIMLYMKNADIEYADAGLTVLFVLFGGCNILRLPAQMLINASGHFKETRNRAIIEACLCVGLQLVFAPIWGLYGVLIASIISLGWRCLDIIIYSNSIILRNNFSVAIKYIMKNLIIPLGSYVVFSLLISISDISYIGFIKYAACSALLTLLMIGIYDGVFYREQLNMSLSIIMHRILLMH